MADGGEHQPGQGHREGEADVGCASARRRCWSRRARPTTTRQTAATSTRDVRRHHGARPGAPGGRRAHASSIAARGVPPSGDRSPRRRDDGGDRRGTALPAGRVVGTAESSGTSQTAATTSPNRSHDRDDLSTLPLPLAPTSPRRLRTPPTSPTRPFLLHGRVLTAGALAWSASILRRRPGPARHGRPRRLRGRLRPVPGRSALPAPRAVAHPGPRRRSDRSRRAPLRGVRGRHGDRPRRSSMPSASPTSTRPAGSRSTSSGRCRCSACSSSASASRSPAGGRA